MKTLKLTIASLLIACGFTAAKAQTHVSFGLSVGTPVHRVYYEPAPYYDETVVERYPAYPVRREVFVERAPVRRVYYSRGYYGRPVYVRHGYGHYRHERFERRHW